MWPRHMKTCVHVTIKVNYLYFILIKFSCLDHATTCLHTVNMFVLNCFFSQKQCVTNAHSTEFQQKDSPAHSRSLVIARF